MNILPNARDFDYDVRKLLGLDPTPPLPYTEVSLTISGLGAGNTWKGLSNGTHCLDGFETLMGDARHVWVTSSSAKVSRLILFSDIMGSGGTNPININGPFGSSVDTVPGKKQGWKLRDGTGTANTALYTVATDGGTPSITAPSFSTTTLNGVTYTWSKGADWSRGNM